MYALTIRQPWAHAIVHGSKRIENRTWAPNVELVGQRFAVHAGAVVEPVDLRDRGISLLETIVRSAIIGVVTLDRVVRHTRDVPVEQREWWDGPIGWLMCDVIAFEPVECAGARGLWNLSPAVLADVERRIRGQR